MPEMCSDGEDDDDMALEEMPPGVVEIQRGRQRQPQVRSAQVGEQEDIQITESAGRDQVEADTIAAGDYERLKERMRRNLPEEVLTDMAQVQPVCKLLNRSLAEGMALISAWGVLMLYRAILYDTGANCNIIPIRRVLELGLAIYDVETSARVTRCDGTPTAFSKYCYVEVVLAAGTPYMTLHRLHAFISYASHTTWDFLVGTGPLKNALRITLDLYRGTAISEAPLLLGMKQKVVLPLIELKAPVDGGRKRERDPRVCLMSEIYDRTATQTHAVTDLMEAPDDDIALQVNVGERPLWTEDTPRHCPSLTMGEREDSRAAFLAKSRRPWVGSMCHSWDVDPRSHQEKPGSWAEQRLFVDRHGWARLCRLVPPEAALTHCEASDPNLVLVQFQRCRQLKWVAEKELHWPDFTSVDQEWDPRSLSWQTCADTKPGKDKVEPPNCHWLRNDHPENWPVIQQLQDSLVQVQKLPSGLTKGTLMWDLELHTFGVRTNSTSESLDIDKAIGSESPEWLLAQ
ncbi:hypothetical protein CYMTET_37010 [Cymbomonas tetramitiformis]|uniref:Uncharacterized protein n=1 Tax=Cymbomonas tetramitiformis TaxID=36881 RepID=A0AAE0F7Q5_9CHLO|nr:hypothetical protein CYMTET_37010 [Cymbomonas tetramitiformis]